MSRRSNNVWESLRLWESEDEDFLDGDEVGGGLPEGDNVRIELPRAWAEEFLRALVTALEIEDLGGEPDMEDEPHMEPDEDDMGGPDDGDTDDDLLPAGDDDDDDEEELEDAFDPDEDGDRPGTALGESAFSKLTKKFQKQGLKNPAGMAYKAGEKKYGKKGMAKKAAAGRKK